MRSNAKYSGSSGSCHSHSSHLAHSGKSAHSGFVVTREAPAYDRQPSRQIGGRHTGDG